MTEEKKGRVTGTLLIWFVTGAVAVGIVFAAITISKKKAGIDDVPTEIVQQPYVAERLPEVGVTRSFPDEEEPVAVPEVIVEEENVTLDSLLAGSFPHELTVSGSRITEGLRFPLEYTCYRNNKSPSMSWSDAPSRTKSMAMILVRKLDDGQYFLNWGVYNIKPSETSLRGFRPTEKALESGALQARNDHRNFGYTGPCEPKGKFPYSFYLFALDTMLDSEADMKLQDMLTAMDGHIVDVANLNAEHYLRY